MGRVVSILWILAALVVTMFALTALLHNFGLADTEWRRPLYGLGQIYNAFAEQSFSVVSGFVDERLGLTLPFWTIHAVAVYAASASAIAAGAIGVARRESFIDSAKSVGAAAAWPLTLLLFVWKTIRLRIVSRFAKDHSVALLVYGLAIAGLYGGARHVNAYYLTAPKNGDPVFLSENGKIESATRTLASVKTPDLAAPARRARALNPAAPPRVVRHAGFDGRFDKILRRQARERAAFIAIETADASRAAEWERLTDETIRLYDEEDYDAATQVAERALELAEEAFGPDHENTLTSVANLAALYHEQGRYSDAEILYKRALDGNERLYGPEGPDTILSVYDLALLYHERGEYAEAEALYLRAVDASERVLGPDDADTLNIRSNLASLYQDQGRYADAESMFKQDLESMERLYGPEHLDTLTAVNNLAVVYDAQGRYSEADALYKRVIEARKRIQGLEHADTITSMSNWGVSLLDQGRYLEAEPILAFVFEIRERDLDADDADTLTSAVNLAELYHYQGRGDEAEPLYLRAFAGFERVLGPEHPLTLTVMNNLALFYDSQGRLEEAESYFRRALELRRRVLGEDHSDTLISAMNLASFLRAQDRHDEAEALSERAYEAFERVLGPEHPLTLTMLNNLALLYEVQGRFAEAEALIKRTIAVRERVLGEGHPDLLASINNLALFYFIQGRDADAAATYAQVLRGLGQGYFAPDLSSAGRELVRTKYTRDHVLPNVYLLLSDPYTDIQDLQDLSSAVLSTSQLLKDSSVSASIAQSSVSSDLPPPLRALIDQHDAVFVNRARSLAELNFQINLPERDRDVDRMERLYRAADDDAARLRAIEEEIRAKFPDYAALSIPAGLEANEVGELLQEGEALIAYAAAGEDGELIAIVATADGGASAVALASVGEDLETRIEALRAGVALPSGGEVTAASLAALSFDMAAAARLYDDLFRPLERLIGDARRVIVVSDGPLESLPFNLLVRADAAHADPGDAFAKYREAQWLIDRYAVSTAPTISSLRALRRKGASAAPNPFIGFGNPVLEGSAGVETRQALTAAEIGPIRLGTLGGGATNVRAVRELSPAPQTETMLRALADELGASASDLFTGPRGSEAALMKLDASDDLARYRVAAFATHALVAGELEKIGLNEPALVMTPPANDDAPPADNDGLLRASEVVGLTLDADWVLLTACNTAADDGTLGAEPLSGLAKSFFYAGARSLLVSHWPAEAHATARLAPAMIKANEQGASKTEALQQAMRAMKEDQSCPAGETRTTTCPENAHPALWGPFAIVGEGR